MTYIFFGHRGWIASQFLPLLNKAGHTVVLPQKYADDPEYVEKLINIHKPVGIICFAGRTHGEGSNTIDYLEGSGKLRENLRDNLYTPTLLATLCKKYEIHLTYLGTGCIFNGYDKPDGYTEDDKPDFFGSSYSCVKGYTDLLMKQFDDTVLNVRIRMPITEKKHRRNFITKILHYNKICSMPNSMTVLPTLLPFLLDMVEKKITGTINLVNPGTISHNEILEMWKAHRDPSITWENISLEEQREMLKSDRSNNQLNTSKLLELYPEIPDIKTDILNIVKKN